MANSNALSVAQNFETFFNGWLVRQERFHQQLVQALRIKCETRREERELTQDSAAIQERLAALSLLNLVRRYGGRIDGKLSELESAMENMKVEMLRALERADKLRRSTVKKLIQTLSQSRQ
ncbi:hypothetical protein V6N13_091715 [Hibiscus sabdariffa]|uniref:DOG1 domain-containing protein n=1 Tax=Hibiscus sabdariffa TaxID=183260 RepID=A0ABR2QEP8_9ROSI